MSSRATRGEDLTQATLVPEGAERGAGIALPERYEDLCLLGSGGFGEVRRVYDRRLERVVAMKLLRPDAGDTRTLARRFLAEIRLTAALHHPGIIAVHDYGELDDGRLWFTMPEVRGRTLRAVIREAYSPPRPDPHDSLERPRRRRRLIDLFARVCEAMAYAHSRGVIHRDLKPENIMVGEFGQVIVMDWGIARRTSLEYTEHPGGAMRPAREDAASDEAGGQGLTQRGDVLGTPAYMPPEQASGEIHRLGPSADVYSLGAILHHMLTGRPPVRGPRDSESGLALSLTGRPPVQGPRDSESGLALSEEAAPLAEDEATAELGAICARAMAAEPGDRYADAGQMATEIDASLSGARRRERAREELGRALEQGPAIEDLRARAQALSAGAKSRLSSTRPFDPVEEKLPGWEMEDEAARLRQEAALGETRWIQLVHGALAIDPELPEAHAALADHYRDRLAEAERARRHEEAARAEVLLRSHDRGRHAAFLSGRGALTLVTEPPGARVILERYERRRRRLEPVIVGEIGPSPIRELPLEKGSYRLRISAPGRAEVRYPARIERGEVWDGQRPGSVGPTPIVLPREGEIDDDEVLVPGGFAWTGGDPDAPDSLPLARVWIDGFVVGRFAVTNEEYLAFLNGLVRAGREAEALLACPRANRGFVEGANDELSYRRGADGLFRLKEKDLGQTWTPRGPVALVSWHGAVEYTQWLAAVKGRPYRLLHELEREKAARGVDGRLFPWGDSFDPTWACMLASHRGEPARVEVDAYPEDESPYGMRGGAGNSHDWCGNAWTVEGPRIADQRLCDAAEAGSGEYRSVRGGAWSSVENHCRAATRFALGPEQRLSATGLRRCRSFP